MNIISYRGPGMAGGVSAALDRLFKSSDAKQSWWFLDGAHIKCQVRHSTDRFYGSLSKELCEAHYRYCNEFLWPILHDLSEHAVYNADDHIAYNQFNKILAKAVMQQPNSAPYFVQDYQLALMPKLLGRHQIRTAIFWHIPWPKNVPVQYVSQFIEIAQGLNAADAVGFHTQEYANNFKEFVSQHLAMRPMPLKSHMHLVSTGSEDYCQSVDGNLALALLGGPSKKNDARVIVAPLALDLEYWHSISNDDSQAVVNHSLMKIPFILSVERADYTKGVVNRLQAVDCFFEKYPEYRGAVSFIQICGRTRAGIKAYDDYWFKCKNLLAKVNEKFAFDKWQPVVSIEEPFSSAELALLYKNASVMLVNPIRDGLNLTAKEFVVCQGKKPGVLALSQGAGVFEELAQGAVPVDPNNVVEMAKVIHSCLNMSIEDKEQKMTQLKQKLYSVSLQDWFDTFTGLFGDNIFSSNVFAQELLLKNKAG